MFVGLLTAPISSWNFEKLVNWASSNGFKGLEVSVSPATRQIDINRVLSGGASEIKKLIGQNNIEITSLAYYTIKILENPADQEFLKKVIDACAALDVTVACTLAGEPVKGKSKIQTLREEFPNVFTPLVDRAKEQGIKLAMENWFETNLQGLDTFQAAFEAVPDKTLGLNFDPSHLVWQKIDYIEAVYKFGDRIHHTHAKDTEIIEHMLRHVGVLGRGWWRYRIPGWGSINWSAYLTALKEVKYDYVLSIEHEDPFFTAEDGFKKAKQFLERFL
ncbi:MAG: sugar phosphate isomerase/epimerase [Candidatus Bathyarchaeia archaeon]|nr:sugar phosphate isomerase/epimerase [Candidatus Bathyarchaeota archaeon]